MTLYLVGIIVVSVLVHVLTFRLLVTQLRVIGELGDTCAALETELESRQS